MLPEECDKPYIRIRGTRLGGRYKIANVLTPTYDRVHQREAEETRANARLIAAAPDLLEACKVAFHQTCSAGRPKDWEQLRAAIAKATGAV
jgi:hypothetical protein